MITIQTCWATIDKNGNYIDIFDTLQEAQEAIVDTKEAVNFKKGYTIVGETPEENGLIVDYTENFYEHKREAEEALKNLRRFIYEKY
jgi:uncharacterized protein YkvS